MSPLPRAAGRLLRRIAALLRTLRYDPDPYGTGSHTRRAGEPDMRSAEDSIRHGSVVSGFSAMGNNG